MALGTIYNKIALISPYVEIGLRKLYWRNEEKLKKYSPNKAASLTKESDEEHADFEKVVNWLKAQGIGEGSLLIVHSGFAELEKTRLSPEQIVDRLLSLVGPTGTLAMPVIRRYKEAEKAAKEGKDKCDVICKYDVKKTMITSGLLPYTLMHKEGAVISHHPFNPLCAIGPLAKEMMEHNIDGAAPSPHGPNSSWKFCYDHGGKVCSIGTDIEHLNTIMHIAEEAFGNWYWSDDIWYDKLKFVIVDEQKNRKEVVVSNRKEEWGKLHIAEINVCKEEKKVGAMKSDMVDGITVGFVDPQKMLSMLQCKNKKGYPYYVYPWENVNKIK